MAIATAPAPTYCIEPSWWHSRLMALLSARSQAAATVEATTAALMDAKHALLLAETGAWLNTALDEVKPADKREVVLWSQCYAEHGAIQTAERDQRQARAALEHCDLELKVLLALGRLVGDSAAPEGAPQ